MIYPQPLRQGSRIAITAFSAGIAETHKKRFCEIVRTIENRGYDVSTLAVSIHSMIGWATVHCSNLMDLIDTNVDPLLVNTLNYLETPMGGSFTQASSEKHTIRWPQIEIDPLAYVVGEHNTTWKWLQKSAHDIRQWLK
ncbi:MAG: hypothetical protein Q7L07_01425 [Pseudohongiella sp.]|nr:hypothetical protein [Pseudohongiella sp.]